MTASEALDRVYDAHGVRFWLEGRCPGGEVGAHYARNEDGERFVFKWSDVEDDFSYLAAVADRVALLRASGYPAPTYLPPLLIEGGVVLFHASTLQLRHDASSNQDGADLGNEAHSEGPRRIACGANAIGDAGEHVHHHRPNDDGHG